MTDVGIVYGTCRERVSELARDLAAEQLETRVPAFPDWTVHDALAHLVGVAVDLQAGNLDGVGSEEWTAAQVDARRAATVTELIAEWGAASGAVEEGLRAIGGVMAAMAIADTWNHEQDIRGAPTTALPC